MCKQLLWIVIANAEWGKGRWRWWWWWWWWWWCRCCCCCCCWCCCCCCWCCCCWCLLFVVCCLLIPQCHRSRGISGPFVGTINPSTFIELCVFFLGGGGMTKTIETSSRSNLPPFCGALKGWSTHQIQWLQVTHFISITVEAPVTPQPKIGPSPSLQRIIYCKPSSSFTVLFFFLASSWIAWGEFVNFSRFLALLPATLLRINGLRHLLNGGLGLRVDVDGKVWCASQCGLSGLCLWEWLRGESAGWFVKTMTCQIHFGRIQGHKTWVKFSNYICF